MLLPILLIVLASCAAGIVAYGTHPALAQQARGLEMIMLARRLEWPLVTISLILCITLLALVISNKRRAWWLIGLAPVLALFIHRYAPPPSQRIYILDAPETMIDLDQGYLPRDDAWVVGIVFDNQSYALPYSALYTTPLVFITDYDKRVLLMWSARANRATAFRLARELKARDLEIVSRPADTLLIYDRRLGQFIVALTGQTPHGDKPVGLGQPLATVKTTWAMWRKAHPKTKVLRGYEAPNAPSGPIAPTLAFKRVDDAAAETRIALVNLPSPAAFLSDSIGKHLVHTTIGQTRILLLRDPSTLRLRAFDRAVQDDLFPKFTLKTDRRYPGAVMVDAESNSWWTIDGKAIEGPLKGSQMKELPVEEDLYWGVMKYWYPGLTLVK